MWLRLLILGLSVCTLAAVPRAEEKPYRVSLLGDGFDGTAWHTGVVISLDPGWKTYWRMPGEAGVPPEFTWQTSAPAHVEVSYPTPSRHADQSGEAVGYENEVLFPVTVKAEKQGPLDLKLDLFFAVCKDICIPASAKATIALGPMLHDPDGASRVEAALRQVPAAGSAISGARLDSEGGKPVLVLALEEKPDDIFVETPTSAYFRAPQFSSDGKTARLPIDNLKDPAKIAGTELKLTYRIGPQGFEQSLNLP